MGSYPKTIRDENGFVKVIVARERHMFNCSKRPFEQSRDLDDPETFELLDDRQPLPSLDVVQDDETAQSPPSSSFILSIVFSCSQTLPTALLSGT